MSHASVLVALDSSFLAPTLEERVAFAMRPFEEGAEWFEDGTRWDWWVIGGRYAGRLNEANFMPVSELNPKELAAKKEREAREEWEAMQQRERTDWPLFFGEKPDATIESLLAGAKRSWFPAHYAFLHRGKWHERERLGFFGGTAKTECEIAGQPNTHRCKAKAKNAPEAYIVTWGDDWETWDFKFYDRFIKTLPPEAVLVTVDYHI